MPIFFQFSTTACTGHEPIKMLDKKRTLVSLNFIHSSRYVLQLYKKDVYFVYCSLLNLNNEFDFPVKANMVCLQTLLCFPFYFSKWRGTPYKLSYFENHSLVVHFKLFYENFHQRLRGIAKKWDGCFIENSKNSWHQASLCTVRAPL